MKKRWPSLKLVKYKERFSTRACTQAGGITVKNEYSQRRYQEKRNLGKYEIAEKRVSDAISFIIILRIYLADDQWIASLTSSDKVKAC